MMNTVSSHETQALDAVMPAIAQSQVGDHYIVGRDEEYVGHGVGMSLDLHVCDGALIFRSRDYFVRAFGRRFVLPRWLSPGELTVIHAEVADGRFSFTLQLVHPRFGLILRQMALYRELPS